MKTLEGTVAIVTGASSGIGEATALILADNGAKVALVARRGERLGALTARIENAGGTALAVESDITGDGQVEAVVAKTIDTFGRLDILVNNAGVMLLGPVREARPDDWQRMIDLNVIALMKLSQVALPHLLAAAGMAPRDVADIVNISSTAGRISRSGAAVYAATKFAVGAFSESLRQEITKQHVRVGLVEPGRTVSELIDQNSPEIRASLAKILAMEDPLLSQDIADAVLYVVTRPRRVAINEMLVRPTEQDY